MSCPPYLNPGVDPSMMHRAIIYFRHTWTKVEWEMNKNGAESPLSGLILHYRKNNILWQVLEGKGHNSTIQ